MNCTEKRRIKSKYCRQRSSGHANIKNDRFIEKESIEKNPKKKKVCTLAQCFNLTKESYTVSIDCTVK